MKAFSEVLVFAGVGDEAGVELDWFKRADEGRDLLDDRGRNTSLFEKDFWYFAFGEDDGINADGRWGSVLDCF